MIVLLKFLVLLLLTFTPFSFAATEPWAFSIVQGILGIIAGLLLFSRRELVYPSLSKPILCIFAVVIGFCLIQSCFPQTLLEAAPFYPITLMRLYTLEHASLFVTYLAIVVVTMQLFQSKTQVTQLVWMMVVSAVLVALCALTFPNGEYVAKLTGVTKYYGAIGPFVNRNHAGMYFVLNALLAWGLFFTRQLKYSIMITRTQKQSFYVQQGALMMLAVGLMVAVIFTRSRGAMLSLLIGLFTYAFLCVWCIPHKLKKRLQGFFCTFLILILSIGWVYTHVEEINEFSHRTSGMSTEIRTMMYRSSGNILKKYPLWGVGIGAMPVIIPSYTEWKVRSYIERLHNDWLEMALGMGCIGTGLVLLGLLWFWCRALQRLKRLNIRKQFLFASFLSALVAMAVGSVVDFHFFIPGCALVFFLILGAVLAPTFHKHHIHQLSLPLVGRVLLLILLLSAGWIPLQKTRCWRAFFMGRGLKTQTKIEIFEKGLTYYPTPRYAARLAFAYYKAGLHSKDMLYKLYYLQMAQQTARQYLEQYPKDKELSRVYLNAQHHLN